ncbi:RDD family protein [Flavobacterium fluvii]|uniref:RDD family protein n=1 Tax=Flavobacterium fluvii TaxID=468056 RepID=A0A1M5NRI1_9FLAO|nr:RDD family protein [Flavobacterium fluvii]SHG92055.1 RDD family protein [Flavobacterium fluvii]
MTEFKEFENDNYELKKTEVLRKNGAGIIDAILVLVIQTTLFHYFPKLSNLIEFPNQLSFMFFYVFVIFIMYRFLTIFAFGKTIGMAILNMQFAKRNETKLSFKEKTLSVVMIYTNTVDCYHLE